MEDKLKTEGKFRYVEAGEGPVILILHGLMGSLDNFEETFKHFSTNGYHVVFPLLPLYEMPLLKTNVKHLALFVKDFLDYKKIDKVTLIGNSLGGHIGLYFTKNHPEKITSLVLTGSSGLYEKAMGDSFPKRGDKEYMTKKIQNVFYDPATATQKMIDEVFALVNDRNSVIRTLAMAKSAIRHNMGKDLPEMKQPTCIIWGKQDIVTPPEVADDFHRLLPDSDLFWIDKCGHAAMMERPEEFNSYLENWLKERNI